MHDVHILSFPPLSISPFYSFPPLPLLSPSPPSISELLQVDLLEDLILSTCIKHSGSVSVFKLITADISDNDKSLLDDIFTRINGLERRLQVSLFQISVLRIFCLKYYIFVYFFLPWKLRFVHVHLCDSILHVHCLLMSCDYMYMYMY